MANSSGAALLIGLALAGGTALADASQRAQRDQTVYIGVLDREGRPPETLSPADITIREDGVAREVLAVAPATAPLHIAIVVDTSAASQGSIPDLREGVRRFAHAIWTASPDSQIALYSFGERPTLESDYTSSASALGRGVDRLFAATGSGAYFIEAVMTAARSLAKHTPARGVVVAYVDENGPEFSNLRHGQVEDALAAARASLWTITRQGFGTAAMSPESRERASVVSDVATRSGGRGVTVFAASALRDRFTDVAAALTAQFAVTYARPDTLIPPERLEVRLTLDGYRLTAPRWTGR